MTETKEGGLILSREEYERIMRDCESIKEYCKILKELMDYGLVVPGYGKKKLLN